jgi:hypothetical protein
VLGTFNFGATLVGFVLAAAAGVGIGLVVGCWPRLCIGI